MLRNGDQRRIEHPALRGGGHHAGHEQPEMLGKAERTNEVRARSRPRTTMVSSFELDIAELCRS